MNPDFSVDGQEKVRVENLSFNAYNKSEVLRNSAENYCKRIGRYSERIFAD